MGVGRCPLRLLEALGEASALATGWRGREAGGMRSSAAASSSRRRFLGFGRNPGRLEPLVGAGRPLAASCAYGSSGC